MSEFLSNMNNTLIEAQFIAAEAQDGLGGIELTNRQAALIFIGVNAVILTVAANSTPETPEERREKHEARMSKYYKGIMDSCDAGRDKLSQQLMQNSAHIEAPHLFRPVGEVYFMHENKARDEEAGLLPRKRSECKLIRCGCGRSGWPLRGHNVNKPKGRAILEQYRAESTTLEASSESS